MAKCLDIYRELEDPKSKRSLERAIALNKELKALGYSPEQKAQVSFVGHSGGTAVGISLAALSKDPKASTLLNFDIVELTAIGSPISKGHHSNIPSGIEINIVDGKRDEITGPIQLAESTLGLGEMKLITSKSLPKNRVSYFTSNSDHMGYMLDKTMLKKVVPESLQVGPIK